MLISGAAHGIPGFVLLYAIIAWPQRISANYGYMVVMPKVFRPDVEEVLSVTILKPTEPIYVQAKLFSKTGHLIAESGHEIFGKGTLNVKTPRDAKGLCTLKICGNCISVREGSFSFYNSSLVTVEEKGTSVFLQTDKPVYKPGQTVHINAFITGPDLQPATQKLVLSLLDPNNSQITKWTDLQPLCCGLLNISYPLSDQPVLGTWTVMAQAQGQVYKRRFDILKYTLPKFAVSISPPAFIRDWKACENIYIAAKYTFGQGVHGKVRLEYSVRGIGYYSDHFGPTVVKHSTIAGSRGFNVCVSDVAPDKLPDHFRGQLHLKAEVTAPDGSIVEASDDSCPVNKQIVDLQFSRDTRQNFKPGLSFKGRILVQYPDGSPADNVTVVLDVLVDGIDFSRQSYVTPGGDAHFNIPSLPAIAQTMTLNARVDSIEGVPVPESYFSAYLTLNSWYSPSKCHLLIDSKTNKYKVGEEGKFTMHSTCPCDLDMYYEVKARGNIVYSGVHFSRHERKRTKSNAETANSKMPLFHQRRQNDGQGVKTCTVSITFLITHEMAPFSRLLVYYVKPEGEGVADTIVFEAEPDFRNEMSIELSDPDAMPGEDIKLHVQTRPGSCVCLGAVDKSVHLLKPDYMLSKKEKSTD